ncbi:hypothetical protein [Ramlibacter tataouinensis]|uniref:Uncharacterized protein n=1 Tax=Ramlibacter tataouinensis (strain ATCC BAA-407 / DSM 14655 / LMG 21543 / TTB310) TaxID=365046 RepID=F5Y3F8_RAMTT|nr:hypothetical protein [Ramlibacter tataouinensis]AEG92432.1 hypothetical protein Rta_13450 [Ramlibacter tataouinensis TTB310]
MQGRLRLPAIALAIVVAACGGGGGGSSGTGATGGPGTPGTSPGTGGGPGTTPGTSVNVDVAPASTRLASIPAGTSLTESMAYMGDQFEVAKYRRANLIDDNGRNLVYAVRADGNARPRAYDVYSLTEQGPVQIYSGVARNSSVSAGCEAGARYLLDADGTEVLMAENPAGGAGGCSGAGRVISIPLANPAATSIVATNGGARLSTHNLVATANHHEIAVAGFEATNQTLRRVVFADRPGRQAATVKTFQSSTLSFGNVINDYNGALIARPECCSGRVRVVAQEGIQPASLWELDFVTIPAIVRIGQAAPAVPTDPNPLIGKVGIAVGGLVVSRDGTSGEAFGATYSASADNIIGRLCQLDATRFFRLYNDLQEPNPGIPRHAEAQRDNVCNNPIFPARLQTDFVRGSFAIFRSGNLIASMNLLDPSQVKIMREPRPNGLVSEIYTVSANGRWVVLRQAQPAGGQMQFLVHDSFAWPDLP